MLCRQAGGCVKICLQILLFHQQTYKFLNASYRRKTISSVLQCMHIAYFWMCISVHICICLCACSLPCKTHVMSLYKCLCFIFLCLAVLNGFARGNVFVLRSLYSVCTHVHIDTYFCVDVCYDKSTNMITVQMSLGCHLVKPYINFLYMAESLIRLLLVHVCVCMCVLVWVCMRLSMVHTSI